MKFRHGMWFVAVLGSIIFLGSAGAWTQTQPMRGQDNPTAAAKTNTCTQGPNGTVTGCPPPGEGNNDILLGRRMLSQTSDLVVADPALQSGSKLQMRVWQYYTDSNFISSESSVLAVGNPSNMSRQYYPLPQQTRSARLFDLPHDELVTVGQDADSNLLGIYIGNNKVLDLPGDGTWRQYDKLQMAVGDVTGDGYDDLIIMNSSTIYVVTAKDVENPNLGLRLIAQQDLCPSGPCTDLQPESQPVVADFGGDGVPVLAWVGGHLGGKQFTAGDQWVYFARICIQNINGANHSTYCSTQPKDSISISTSKIDLGFTGAGHYCVATSALAAGQFFMGPNFTSSEESTARQLLIAHTRTAKLSTDASVRHCAVDLSDYSFGANPKLEPTQRNQVLAAARRRNRVLLYAASDRLNWWGNQDQVVLALSGDSLNDPVFENRNVKVVTFDNTGKMDIATSKQLGNNNSRWHIAGLATGRFNSDNSNADNFNPRIAILSVGFSNNVSNQNKDDAILFLHPQDPEHGQWTPIIDKTYTDTRTHYRYDNFSFTVGNNRLQAGDFQGRSVRLGNPAIARIDTYLQPRAIAPIPPMMVDLVPWGDRGTPTVVNFTAIPASFWSKFNTTVSSTDQSSTQSTTGSTVAGEVHIGGTLGIVWPGNVSETASYQHSYENTQTNTVSHNYDTYALSAFDVSAQTNRQDVVWFSEGNLNLFYYPIIGGGVCPENNPGCPADEQSPASVLFAGPSNDTNGYDVGLDTWYQPVHQPFQLFSYPRTVVQLEEGLGLPVGLQPLTQAQTFNTGNNILETYGARWNNETTESSSVGTTTEITNSNTFSVNVGPTDWKKVVGVGASVEFGGSVSESTSTRDVALNSTKLGQSSGISGSVPGTFREPPLKYEYSFTPEVFGQAPEPNEEPGKVNADITTHGILLGTFLADAASQGEGGYWKSPDSPYNQKDVPDIAINHPTRWTFGMRKYDLGGAPPECLRTTGVEYQCAYEWRPEPVNLWGSQYYNMRGLSITQDLPSGSQVTQTTQGRTIYLSARIYNYSFQPMPPGSTLHVQFYRQPWDISTNTPAGVAVQINQGAEEIVRNGDGDPVRIPPYGAEAPDYPTEPPNWVIARTSFNTTGLAGNYVFWVVAWAQDGKSLVPEVANHGLSKIPGENLPDIGDVPLQYVNVRYPSSADNSGMTSFTNNVGFFRQVFYVAPAAKKNAAPRAAVHPQLEIEDATVTPIPEQSGTYAVSADLMALKGPATGVVATAVDLTAAGARPFDMELIPDIDANHTDRAELVYTPGTCGPKHLEIEVRGSHSGSVTRRVNLEVPCGD